MSDNKTRTIAIHVPLFVGAVVEVDLTEDGHVPNTAVLNSTVISVGHIMPCEGRFPDDVDAEMIALYARASLLRAEADKMEAEITKKYKQEVAGVGTVRQAKTEEVN